MKSASMQRDEKASFHSLQKYLWRPDYVTGLHK